MRRSLSVALLLLSGVAACRSDAPTPEVDERDRFRNVSDSSVAYTGDRVCASCHEDLWRSYQGHGMARSMYRLTDSTVVEDFGAAPVFHAATRFYYRPYREGSRFYQEEYRLGPGGEKTHSLVREVAYVVGSGSAARTYLAESNGRLYELPLTWYTQARRWDFSPGYAEDNARFDRIVGDRCIACHSAYPTPTGTAQDKFARVPLGIGCERCHGPGALHVEARLARPDVQGVDETIVNPAHLSLPRRLDVCQQCHLQGTVMLLREGETAYSFRPGMAMAAHQALFSVQQTEGEGRIGVISHAERMQQSPCFRETQATARPLECTTCHDPHAGFRDRGPEYFNAACRTCHAPADLAAQVPPEARAQHTAQANCTSCHMPKVESEAPHSSFTDHYIRVVRQRAAPPADASGGETTLVAHFDRDREGAQARIYEGMAYVVYGRQRGDEAALRRGVDLLADALGGEDQRYGEAHFLLGFARLQLGQPGEAVAPLESAVRLAPNVAERLNALAQAYEATGRAPEAAPRYQAALQAAPDQAPIRVNHGRLLEAQGQLAAAAAQYRQAAIEQPWLFAARFNLGTALLRLGDLAGGEAALREAVGLMPDDPEARGNLGSLYAGTGRPALARAQFTAAAEAAPTSPTALGNLGAFLLNSGELVRAESLLSRAVTLNPGYADGLVNLALVHLRQGNAQAAAMRAQQALQVRPGDPRAQQILGALQGR
jgi:Tfp pilus assembly protein PilF